MAQAAGQPGPYFPTTHWSLVRRAGEGEGRNDALGQLLTRYLPALRAHLVLARGVAAQDADDILQGFVADKVIQGRLIQHASEFRGRFRTFLLAVLNHYARNLHRHAHAQRRAPPTPPESITDQAVPDRRSTPPELPFALAWAREVIRQALQQMEQECAATGRADLWGVFQDRLARPILDGAVPQSYDALVERHGYATAAEAYNALVTAKRMYARVVRQVVATYARDETEVEQELRDLLATVGQGGAGSGDAPCI